VKFYTIGKKGKDQLGRTFRSDIVRSIEPGDLGKLGFADVQVWAEDLTARFEAGEFDVAHLFFSKFVSVLNQEPTQLQLMPVAVAPSEGGAPVSAAVEYEPDEEEILADLLPRNVAVQLLRAQRENAASEQGSKMTAMDNATRNAGDMINKLTIQYNRSRQAAITTELIEIIAGAEAL
jgi:F-type H+-transporting ATPase subunit gamma